jgi:hypothetical protein
VGWAINVHALAQLWADPRDCLSSSVLVYRHGGGFHPFVGARIVKGIMRFVANGMMVTTDSSGNVIGRGRVGVLNEVFSVKL